MSKFSPQSRQYAREVMCESKVAYKSRAAAAATIRFLHYKRKGLTKEHRPYSCPHCHQWHIGHKL